MPDVRGHNEGSIFERSDGRWVAAVSLGNGQRAYRYAKSKGKAGKAEAKELLRDLQRQRDAGTTTASRLTLGAYLDRWLDDVKPRLAPATWSKYEQHVRVHLAPALGKHRLSDLRVDHVRGYLRGMAEVLDPQTLRHHRATLRRALADALRDGHLTRNVAALAEPPKLDRRERPVLNAAEVRILINGTRDDPLGALWTLLATTGLREAEALGLTWEDVNLGTDTRPDVREMPARSIRAPRGTLPPDRGGRGQVQLSGLHAERGTGDGVSVAREATRPGGVPPRGEDVDLGVPAVHEDTDRRLLRGLPGRDGLRPVAGALPDSRPSGSVTVRHTLHRIDGEWQLRAPKTPKSRRTVFLPPVTVEALREHKRRQQEAWLAAGRPGALGLVFVRSDGRPYHGSKLTTLLYPTLARLGLPKVSIHDLRHSAATILYGAGVPLEAIADMLGHSTTRVTSDLYRHRVEQVQRGASEAMERAVGL